MSNKGIGKGLAALLGNMKEEETIAEKSESAVSREIMNVDISLIDTNPYQPRKVFDKAALEELAASIKTFGIIQPLIVLRSGNRYVIIAGERRFRAARLAGLTSVPCVVRELTPREMREIALIENLQREDLNPVEAAEGIAELIKSCDLTQEEAAERIGMSRPVVTNLLRLLSLDKEVLELVRAGRLSGSHARCLVKNGLLSPSCSRSAARLSGDASVPSAASAASPGMISKAKKTRKKQKNQGMTKLYLRLFVKKMQQ